MLIISDYLFAGMFRKCFVRLTPEARKVLGISGNATMEEAKQAYLELAKKHHPDAGGDAEAFQKYKTAFEEVSNPDEGLSYEEGLKNSYKKTGRPNKPKPRAGTYKMDTSWRESYRQTPEEESGYDWHMFWKRTSMVLMFAYVLHVYREPSDVDEDGNIWVDRAVPAIVANLSRHDLPLSQRLVIEERVNRALTNSPVNFSDRSEGFPIRGIGFGSYREKKVIRSRVFQREIDEEKILETAPPKQAVWTIKVPSLVKSSYGAPPVLLTPEAAPLSDELRLERIKHLEKELSSLKDV